MKHLSEEARKVIRLNSVSSNGNEELANYLVTLLKDRGLKTFTQQVTHSMENISKRQFNVIGVLGDPLVDKKTRKGLLLLSHLDTLSPGLSENWNETAGNPFSATFQEGRVYGLGTASAKLDFLCKLKAVEKFREKKLKMPVYLAGTCAEEIGMHGARYLIKSLALNPRYVLIGAPTDLKVVYAHKSSQLFKVSIGFQQVERDARGFNRRIDLISLGRAARASDPSFGLNAVSQMLRLLDRATEAGFELRFAKVGGGDGTNKVPDLASTEFYLTSHQFEEFKRFFREAVQEGALEKAFRVELGGLGNMGVRFLPEAVFKSVCEVLKFFDHFGEELSAVHDGSYLPPHSTVSFSELRQGAGSIEMYFDLRLISGPAGGGDPAEEIRQKIAKGIQTLASRYPSLNVTVTVDRSSPALAMSYDHEWVKLCQEAQHQAGIPAVIEKYHTATEAALYQQAGYDAVVFGPGPAHGNSGSPNEYNLLEHMEKAIHFYEKVIEKTCL